MVENVFLPNGFQLDFLSLSHFPNNGQHLCTHRLLSCDKEIYFSFENILIKEANPVPPCRSLCTPFISVTQLRKSGETTGPLKAPLAETQPSCTPSDALYYIKFSQHCKVLCNAEAIRDPLLGSVFKETGYGI